MRWSFLENRRWFLMYYALMGGGGSVKTTVSGTSPLSLVNALAKPIKKLVQYGKAVVSSGDIVCNNGTLSVVNGEIVVTGTPEEIVVMGVNQWDEEWELGRIDFDKNSETWGQDVQSTSAFRSKNYIPVVSGGTYYVKSATAQYVYTIFYDADKNPVLTTTNAGYVNTANLNMYVPEDGKYIRFYCHNETAYNNDISINYPSTDTAYHKYHRETANAENLLSVGGITDEQDIITGKVTRRTQAVVSDGTEPTARYIGTVGEGNVLVQLLEEGHSGAVASFESDEATPVNGVVCQITPTQDLHGYDSPWSAGGGVNKFDGLFESGTINISTGVEETSQTHSRSVNKIAVDPSNQYCCVRSVSGAVGIRCFASDDSYLGNVSLATGTESTFTPLSGTAYVRIVAQNASAAGNFGLNYPATVLTYVPYENICPISGHTGVTVYDTGINVWDEEWEQGGIGSGTGNNTSTAGAIRSKNYIPVKPETTYFFACSTWSGSVIRARFYDINKTYIGYTTYDSVDVKGERTFITPANCFYMRFVSPSNVTVTESPGNISINFPSANTSYHAYTGTTCPITFGVIGKNLFDGQFEKGTISTDDGSDATSSNNVRSKNYTPIKPGQDYYYQMSSSNYGFHLYFYNKDKTFLRHVSGTAPGGTFTAGENDCFIRFKFDSTGQVSTLQGQKVMLSKGTTQQTYEPYNDTLYCGYMTVNKDGSIDLTATAELEQFNIKDSSVVQSKINVFNKMAGSIYTVGDYQRITFGINNSVDQTKYNRKSSTYDYKISNIARHYNSYTDASVHWYRDTSLYLFLPTALCGSTSTSVYNYLVSLITAGTPVSFWLPYNTPEVIHLDSKVEPILTQVGENNFWCDTGDITVYISTGEITERVAAQKLTTSEGDNTVTVTAEVSDIEFGIEYMQAAEVTP